AALVLCSADWLNAQDLAPRAYLITPVHTNAVTLTYSFFDGSVIFDSQVPITDSTARVNMSVLSLTHSLNFFGRSPNFTASLPYACGNFTGGVTSGEAQAYRSGLMSAAFRFSVKLVGGPAMNLGEFVKWRQKTVLGFSLKVVPPTGQYDSAKL